MSRLTYGARLTIAYTAIFAFALVAFCLIAYASLRLTLHAQLDARLETTATAVRSVPDIRNGRLLFDPDDKQQFLTLLAENRVNGLTIATGGTVLLSNLPRPPAAILHAVGGSSPRRGDVGAGDDALAYMVYPIWEGDRQYGWIAVWAPRAVDDAVARTTIETLMAASVVVIALAVLLGTALIRRMLRPIADLSAMMSEIEATSLSERLAWVGPDDELGRLCTTFDRLLDRLECAFEDQRRFTADASHELRTPLSVMRAEIELALTRERDGDDYRHALARLQAETTRLETLVESLLLAARGATVDGLAQIVFLGDVAQRVVERMMIPAGLAGVVLEVGGDRAACTKADPALLESAALALVDNAIQHTPGGGIVRVAVATENECAIMTITDGGRGFSDRALREATQRFWRDDRSRSGRGTGLGLSIAQSIAQRHGGELLLCNGPFGNGVATLRFVAMTSETLTVPA